MKYFLFICCLICLSCSAGRAIQTELYFGQSKLNGGAVTDNEWNVFVEQYVSRVFTDGSTVIHSSGNWYDTAQKKIIIEPTKIVTSINKMTPQLSSQIDSLRYWYKRLYQQQSVLRVDKKVKMKLF